MAEKNIYQTDPTQKPLIFELIESGNTDEAIKLFSADPLLINLKGWMDVTPLHIAAYQGHFKIVKWLIEHGADVNARRNEGRGETPLYWSSTAEIAEYLIQNGAYLDMECYNTPLNWAVRNQRPDVMKVLLRYGIDINGNSEKQYPILEVRDISCLKVFVEYGANLDLSNVYGNILHHIAWYNNAPLLDYALSVGIKWTRNDSGETPYHTALRGQRNDILEMLKKKYPQFVSDMDKELIIGKETMENISGFVFISSSNTIISIGKNAHLCLWQIGEEKIVLKKRLELNVSSIDSITYKQGERFFIIPGKYGTIELRDIETLSVISEVKLFIKSDVCEIKYSRDGNYLLASESWSPVHKVNLNFEIQGSTDINYYIWGFTFDRDSKLVGVGCADQNEFTDLYRLEKDGTLKLVKDMFVRGEDYSSLICFNPYANGFVIAYTKQIVYYSYYDDEITQIWRKDIHDVKKNCIGYFDFVDKETLIFGYGNILRIIKIEPYSVCYEEMTDGVFIHGIRYADDIKKIIVATNEGFTLINTNSIKMAENTPW